MKRFLVSLACLGLLSVVAFGQTEPPKVTTPDVPKPAGQTVPLVKDPALPEGPLSMDEAVRIALSKKPDVVVAKQNFEQAKGAAIAAGAGGNPQVSVSGLASQSSNTASGGSSGAVSKGLNTSASVTLSQLLFDFGKVASARAQAERKASVAEAQYHQAEHLAAKTVRLAFVTYRQSLLQETFAVGNVANRQRQLDLANARLNAGSANPSEVVQAKAALASATVTLNSTRSTLALAKAALALAMGVDVRADFSVEAPILASEPSLGARDLSEDAVKSTLQQALADRPEMKAEMSQIKAAEAGLSLAKATGQPAFSLTGNLSSRGQGDAFKTQNSTVGLNLTWTPVDGGTRRGAIKSAEAALKGEKATLEVVSQEVTSDVYQALVNRATAAQNLAAAKVQVANAEEFVRIAEGRYKGGLGLFTDTVTASDSLFAAQTNLAQASAAYASAEINLVWATGQG